MKVCPKCGSQYGDDANFCTLDAGRLVPASTLSAGPSPAAPAVRNDLLGGRFELGPRVGGGATGAVHRAVDTQTGAPVAVKVIAPAVVAQPMLAQRVERELKLLEKVDHPAVARVLGSGRHGEQLWFAMEWLEGTLRLSDVVSAGGIEPERASDLTVAIGGALVEAAKVGVVHRDLSPKNVLIGGDGVVKLINFALPVPGERVAGVPSFLSPEAIEGKPVDQRSATYSLGALYYYLLTGQAPFVGDAEAVHAAHQAGGVAPPSQRAPVPADIDALVGRAMERKPTQRFLTLRQFLDDIEKVKKGPDGGASSTASFGRVGKKPKELANTMRGLGPLPGGEEEEAAAASASPPPGVSGGKLPAGMPTVREMSAVAEPTFGAPAFGPPAAAPPVNVGPPHAVTPHVAVAPPPAAATPVAAAAPGMSTLPGYQPPTAAARVATPPAGSPVVAATPPIASPPVVASAPPAIGLAASVGVQPQPAVSGSPWAPPAGAMPAAAAMPMAANPMAATAPHPPIVAAPAVAPAGAGGKKKPEAKDKKSAKSKFRETMWFKKGDLDAAAAEAAATDKEGIAVDKADMLPIEERYGDDGSITTSDAERYSLKTGHTSAIPAMREGGPVRSASVSEDELIGEMKGGRKKFVAMIIAGVVAVVILAILFARM